MKPKEIILSALLAVTGFLSGFIWDKILAAPYWSLVILLYAIIFGFFVLLVKNKWILWGAPVISALLFAVSFHLNMFLLYGAVLGVVAIASAVDAAERELNGSMKLYVKKILRKPAALLFTALAIIAAFSYYGDIKNRPDAVSLLLPKQVFETTLKLFEAPLSNFLPGFRADATVGELIPKSMIPSYSRQFGTRLKSADKISDVLYEFSLARIEDYAGSYAAYAPVIVAVGYFFALKTVSVVFYFAAIFLIFILLKILLASGLIKKIEVQAEKEIYV